MRLSLVALPVLAVVAASGCIGGSGPFGTPALDCSADHDQVVSARSDVLFPSDVPDEARIGFGERPMVTVTAREGQQLIAQASWVPTAGDARPLFDGPSELDVQTDNTAYWTGDVPAGTYTLELEGAPMAYGVVYSLVLMTSGCTPAE